MSLNCSEIEAVVQGLDQPYIIKKFYQSEKSTLILQLFDGKKDCSLLISVLDGYNRICLIPDSCSFPKKEMHFAKLLNAYYCMAKIEKIYQVNYSRIVVIRFSINEQERFLVVRMWGSGGNILLLDDDASIVECLRRMPKRGEWPGEDFDLQQFESRAVSADGYPVRQEFKSDDIQQTIYYHYQEIIQKQRFHKRKTELVSVYGIEVRALKKRLQEIRKNLSFEREEQVKSQAELLKANLYQVTRGMKDIVLEDYESGKPVKIILNPDWTPAQNVERFFDKYKKIKQGRIKWEQEEEKISVRLRFLEQGLEQIHFSENLKQLDKIDKEIRTQFGPSDKNKKGNIKKTLGKIFHLSHGFEAVVSRNAKEAVQILNRIAKGNDYWFHIRDSAGSHVIVKYKKDREITEQVKKEASHLALYYSKSKGASDADIYFTQVKHLHKSKGGPDGLVFPTQEKNIKLQYDAGTIDSIFSNCLKKTKKL